MGVARKLEITLAGFADGVVHRREASTGVQEVLQLSEQLCKHTDEHCVLAQLVVFSCACSIWDGSSSAGGERRGGSDTHTDEQHHDPAARHNLDLLAKVFCGRIRVLVLEPLLAAKKNTPPQKETSTRRSCVVSPDACEARRSCWCECLFEGRRLIVSVCVIARVM